MPSWVSRTTCLNCKKKGHLAFNCPPKYACKVIRPKQQKSKSINSKVTANNVTVETNQVPKITEFAGMVTSKLFYPTTTTRQRYGPNRENNQHRNNFQYHKNKILNITTYEACQFHKDNFYKLLMNRSQNRNLYSTLVNEVGKLNKNNQESVLWLLSFMNRYHKNDN